MDLWPSGTQRTACFFLILLILGERDNENSEFYLLEGKKRFVKDCFDHESNSNTQFVNHSSSLTIWVKHMISVCT